MYIAEIDVGDGEETGLGAAMGDGRSRFMGARRDAKGPRLIFSAIERGATLAQIWFLPYPKGAAQKITNDLNDYRDLSLTDDSTALITVQAETLVNVWLSPNADARQRGARPANH